MTDMQRRIIRRGACDDSQQVGKFLDDFICRRNQKIRMRIVRPRVLNEKASGPFADPLHEPPIAGAANQLFDTVEGIN